MKSTARLHQMYADLLAKNGDDEGAADHYSIAINLDPKAAANAKKGLRRVERGGRNDDQHDTTGETHSAVGGAGTGNSDDSETEAVWSDGDLNLAGSTSSSRYL